MYVEFGERYLLDLYKFGRTRDKKHRFQPEVIRKYQKAVFVLFSVDNISDLQQYNALRYEVLKGDKIGISSVRINLKYRLEFTVRADKDEKIINVCRLLEISNHYK